MQRETSGLLLKSNRILGTRLVEAGLTGIEDMERANKAFAELARAKDLKRASLLRILIYEQQTLREEALVDYQLEHFPVGAVLLENYAVSEAALGAHPLELMHASWTAPIDHVHDRWFLLTAYYMSDVVRNFWEDRLGGRITWYVSPMGQLEMLFEEQAARLAAAQEAPPETATTESKT